MTSCDRCGRDIPVGAQVVMTESGLRHSGCAEKSPGAAVTYASLRRPVVGWLDVLPIAFLDIEQAMKLSKTDAHRVDVGLCAATGSVALQLVLTDGRVAEVAIGAPWWHELEHKLAQLRAEQRK